MKFKVGTNRSKGSVLWIDDHNTKSSRLIITRLFALLKEGSHCYEILVETCTRFTSTAARDRLTSECNWVVLAYAFVSCLTLRSTFRPCSPTCHPNFSFFLLFFSNYAGTYIRDERERDRLRSITRAIVSKKNFLFISINPLRLS